MTNEMFWSGVWGCFTAFVISPAFDLNLTQNIIISIIGALVITAFEKQAE